MKSKEEFENLKKEIEKVETKQVDSFYSWHNFKNKNIMTFGTFDLLHIGHLKIIDHALEIAGCEENLYIGISSDKWNILKGKKSVENQNERLRKIKTAYPNANVFFEDHNYAEQTWPQLWDEYNIDLIVMGGDHVENLSYINNVITPEKNKMKICFFERTPKISSSLIRKNKWF